MTERKNNVDYLMACNKVVATSELGNVQRIIAEIRSISEISSSLEVRAIQRVRSQKQHLRRELDKNISILERMERYNDTLDQQARIVRNIREVRNYLDLYRKNELTITARGKTLQEVCAEMIALLTSIKDTLRENQAGFVYFARDCMDWERSRIDEGF